MTGAHAPRGCLVQRGSPALGAFGSVSRIMQRRNAMRILNVKVKPGAREAQVSIRSGASGRMKLVQLED